MPLLTHCPKCRATFNLPDNLRGKNAQCSRCKQVFLVPAAPAAVPEDVPTVELAEAADVPTVELAAAPAPARPRPAPARRAPDVAPTARAPRGPDGSSPWPWASRCSCSSASLS